MCQICPSLHISKRCCVSEKNTYLNVKGSIIKILEQLEIYCAVNKVNGCKWSGPRVEYFDHYNKCAKKYQPCIFGCGKIIHNNDIIHFDTCKHFNEWLDNGDIDDAEFKKKCLMHIKYNRFNNKIIFDTFKKFEHMIPNDEKK